MPNQPATPSRNIRVADETWEAAKAAAGQIDTTVSAVVVDHLTRFTGARRAWVEPVRITGPHQRTVAELIIDLQDPDAEGRDGYVAHEFRDTYDPELADMDKALLDLGWERLTSWRVESAHADPYYVCAVRRTEPLPHLGNAREPR